MNDEVALRASGSRLLGAERAAGLRMLSARERARLAAERPRRREAFLAGRVLLRELAGEALGTDPAAVPLIASCPDCGREHGRPVITGTDLHVSLSHGADAVVAAVAQGRRIGIDLEHPATVVDDLAPLIPTPSLQRWTRIEAVLKADGRGLRVDPAMVVFEPMATGELASVPGSSIRYLVDEVALPTGQQVSLAIELR